VAGEKFLHRPCAEFSAARATVDFLDLALHQFLQFARLLQRGVEPLAHRVEFAPHGGGDRGDLVGREIFRVGQADRRAGKRLRHEFHFLPAPDRPGEHPYKEEGACHRRRDHTGLEVAKRRDTISAIAAPEKSRHRACPCQARQRSSHGNALARFARDHPVERAARLAVFVRGAYGQVPAGVRLPGHRLVRGFARRPGRRHIVVFHGFFMVFHGHLSGLPGLCINAGLPSCRMPGEASTILARACLRGLCASKGSPRA